MMENMMKNIRNFVIIAHIDSGKSTLADRFLEITGTVSKEKLKDQFLDAMDLEREKGITIKMHPVRLNYKLLTINYQLNLIDTPGHADFSYEISRALACVEGALLLVDAVKGIQAQTLFNLDKAKEQGLEIIPAVNKIDLPYARTNETKKEIAVLLGIDEKDVFSVSAKTGQGVEELIRALVKKIPSPIEPMSPKSDFKGAQKSDFNSPNNQFSRGLVFDSKYDSFSGVIAYVRVFEGEFKKGGRIKFLASNTSAEIKEVGFFSPVLEVCNMIKSGEIGYIKTGIKEPSKVRAGDTISDTMDCEPLRGYKEPRPVLFLSLYPQNSNDFELLKDSLGKLKLNDAALSYSKESKTALGRGFRIGFLGALHAEITIRRLKTEFGLDLLATQPQVMFQVITKNNKELFISSPADWPDPALINEVKEPWVLLEIVTPNIYMGNVIQVLQGFGSFLKETKSVTVQKSILLAEAPLREVISGNFYDKIKSTTKGYASFGMEPIGSRKGGLVKLDILIAGKKEEAFSKIVSRENAFQESKKFLQKLKDILPKQQFTVALQAVISGKIIARETIKARRKDVTASLYGGDVTRKNKLLEIQKKGKKALKAKANVNISASDFLRIINQ